MENKKINLDNNRINKLVIDASKLVKILYFLFVFGIILSSIVVLKELRIVKIILNILKVLSPIFIGFVIAWLFNPLVIKIENKGFPKIVSVLIIYTFIIILTFVFFKIFIPVLYKQINDLIKTLPNIINTISLKLDKISEKFLKEGIDVSEYKDNIINGINVYTKSFSSNIPKYIFDLTGKFIGFLGVILMGLVVGVYILLDYDKLYDKCINFFPPKKCSEIKKLFKTIGDEVRKTVNGTLFIALMVLLGDTVAFSIIGLDSPLLFGVICGITDLIPFIGPYIGGAAAVIVAFTESFGIGIAVLVACILVQSIENYVLQPVVMSKATKLNPVLIIAALLIFGHFFGVIGMILATPIISLSKVIFEYICKKKENTLISD